MKLIIQLYLSLSLLILVQCAPSQVLPEAEVSEDPRLSYRQLYEDPRFQEALKFSNLDYPRLHTAMFYATNAVRVRLGAEPLNHHELLEETAWRYASRMVEKNFLSHEDPYKVSQRTVEQRARAIGVSNARVSENLASYFGIQYQRRERVYVLPGKRGQFSRTPNGKPIPNHTYRSFAEAAIDFWMASPKHRDNLMAKEALQLGCGAAFFRDDKGFPKFKLVQVFQWYEPVQS